MAKLKVGDILPWAILIGGGYLVYTNWNSIQGFFGGLFPQAGASGSPGAGAAPKTYLCADGKTIVADPSICSAYGGGGTQTTSPQLPSLPSGGGASGGGGGGVYIPTNPSPSAPVSGSPSAPSGPVTAPATSQQQADLSYLLANARQFCVDNYCYKCDETGSIGYQCAIISGPGITTPLLVTKAGRPAFANSTRYIGKMCDSKNNCWQCDPTTCVQISFEGGPAPTPSEGTAPPTATPGPTIGSQAPCSISADQYQACIGEVWSQVIPYISQPSVAKGAQQAIWVKYPGCQQAQLLQCQPPTSVPSSGRAASSTPQPTAPATTTPPATSPSSGGHYSDQQILQAWDLNKTGTIDDTDIIAANTAWTESRLIPGATQQQQDDAIRLLTKYWINGTQFTAGGYTPGSSQTIQAVQSRVPAGYTPGASTVSVVGTPTVVSGPTNVGQGITAYLWSNGVWSYTYPNRRVAYRYPNGRVVYA